jgi:hypothetical protein
VQVLERKEQLSSIEPRAILVKLLLALQVVEQLSAVDIRQHEVELRLRLEAPLERDDERGGDPGEDEPFVQGVRYFSLFCDLDGWCCISGWEKGKPREKEEGDVRAPCGSS